MFTEPILSPSNIGPGSYEIPTSIGEKNKLPAWDLSKKERFEHSPKSPLGPGKYDISAKKVPYYKNKPSPTFLS